MNVVRHSTIERGESAIGDRAPSAAARSRQPAPDSKPGVKQKSEWISASVLDKLTSEGTDAHRLCTIDDGWVERFGRETLISFKNTATRDRLILELYFWRTAVGADVARVFGRTVPPNR